ncbi:MAG: zinc ribbon domain-containing protein [Thermodesulfobacteriota bacterium]
MPIYEFTCDFCNVVFSFFSRSVNTEKVPSCPRCGALLERQMSVFSVSRKAGEEKGDDMAGFDEARMERAMTEMARQAESLDEKDPRQSAGLLRKLTDIAGMRLSPGMEEAVRRMEAGEDPETVEQDMAGVLENAPFAAEGKKGSSRRPPVRDEKLYDL